MAVISQGIKCPLIKEGDDIVSIVTDAVLDNSFMELDHYNFYDIKDKDIVGITESVVARAAGLYVTVDDIANDIRKRFSSDKELTIAVINPIYSRNRFATILRGIARAASTIVFVLPEFDEVGNDRDSNQFTGVNIQTEYTHICEEEGCKPVIYNYLRTYPSFNDSLKGIDDYDKPIDLYIDCSLHLKGDISMLAIQSWHRFHPLITLKDICSDKNPDFGVLGTNKATEERLKLYPTTELANKVCKEIKDRIEVATGKDVIVCVYGDGCFKDPEGGIWEFADPVSMPGFTDEDIILSTPNEMKIKYLIDTGQDVDKAIKENNNEIPQMGTTPRMYRDLLASLMDLTSGSGDKGTPVVLIQNYFEKWA